MGRIPKALTTVQMRRIERLAIKRYGIPIFLLMDHAGRNVAEAARTLAFKLRKKKVTVLCGGGHNGGDGVAAARYLQGWGYSVKVFWLKSPVQWKGSLALHYAMARRCGVSFSSFKKIPPRRRVSELRKADILIDALLGTGTTGHLRVPMFDAIAALNAARKPTIAVDVPSGLDADTGRVHDIAVKARLTVTLAAPKKGLLAPRARTFVGKLLVADIGLPR